MKLRIIIVIRGISLVIAVCAGTVRGQDIDKKAPQKEVGLDSEVSYSAKERIRVDQKTNELFLYGDAWVKYENFSINAGFIKIDKQKSEITAQGYKQDPKSERFIDRPIINDNKEEVAADKVVYNYKTKKAKLWQSFSKIDESYVSGKEIKVLGKDEAFLKNMFYTTCSDPYCPHFGFRITKARLKKDLIVAGPIYPEVLGVPFPIALPFGLFPRTNKPRAGFLLPQPGEDARLGFFIKNFGYYFAFNDYIDLVALGSYYTNGSLGLTLTSRYKKLYAYEGMLNFDYSRVVDGEPHTDTYAVSNSYRLTWQYRPSSVGKDGNFNANVDIGTSTYFAENVNQIGLDDRFNSTLNSSITYTHNWRYTPFSLSTALTHYQNLQTDDINISAPNLNFNVAKQYPFRGLTPTGGSNLWYKQINFSYNAALNAQINTKTYLLFKEQMYENLSSGLRHTLPISANFKVFRYFNITPSVSYSGLLYPRSKEYFYNEEKGRIDSVWRQGFVTAHMWSVNAALNTKIYGIKQFGDRSWVKAIRHIVMPSLSYNFRPDGKRHFRAIDYLSNNVPVHYVYSIFAGALFGGPSELTSNKLTFTLDNNLELKVKSEKEQDGYIKIPIFDSFAISSAYDFSADTAKLSNITFWGRSSILNAFSISFSGALDPYIYKTNSKNSYVRSERLVFSKSQWPVLRVFNLSVSGTITPLLFNAAEEKAKLTPQELEDLKLIDLYPDRFLNTRVKWSTTLSYSYNFTKAPGRSEPVRSQTINATGNVSLTPNLGVGFSTGYDLTDKSISPTQLSISRNLHCWTLSIEWIPFGYYKSYFISLQVNSAMLRDIKFTKQYSYAE